MDSAKPLAGGIPMVNIDGARIRRIREEKGLTQLYVATVVGVTTDTISRWENRRYPNIKKENAVKLAEALETRMADILITASPRPRQSRRPPRPMSRPDRKNRRRSQIRQPSQPVRKPRLRSNQPRRKPRRLQPPRPGPSLSRNLSSSCSPPFCCSPLSARP